MRHHLARHDGRRGLDRTSAAAPPVRHDGRHDDQPATEVLARGKKRMQKCEYVWWWVWRVWRRVESVNRSTGHTHTHTTAEHTTAEQTTHTNTERATAQRRLIVEVVVAAPKIARIYEASNEILARVKKSMHTCEYVLWWVCRVRRRVKSVEKGEENIVS